MTIATRTWGLRFRAKERLAQSWLVIPGVYTAAALALGVLTPALQDWLGHPLGLALDESSASAVLQAVASGMIAFTGLVVSVAVLVVQFGAGQYTPRLVLRFRRDPVTKHALGIFIAPAIYALVALTQVGSQQGSAANLSVFFALALLLGAVFSFFLLTARLLDLLRPRRLYAQLRIGGERAIDQVYPRAFDSAGDDRGSVEGEITERVTHQSNNAVLSAMDLPRLLRVATQAGIVLELPVRVGEYVWTDEPIVLVRGGSLGGQHRDALKAVIFAEERTVTQDPSYAMRTIVDIAIRALSPAINDPTTAVQALDTLESILHRLAGRDLGTGELRDAAGVARVIYPAPNWNELLDLALTEIRAYGANSHQIARRMRALLLGLLTRVPEPRHEAVRLHLALLDAAIRNHFDDPAERALASIGDHTGLGGRMDPQEP